MLVISLSRINNYRAHIHEYNSNNNTDEDPDDYRVILELFDVDGGLLLPLLLKHGKSWSLGLRRGPLVCRWWVAF